MAKPYTPPRITFAYLCPRCHNQRLSENWLVVVSFRLCDKDCQCPCHRGGERHSEC